MATASVSDPDFRGMTDREFALARVKAHIAARDGDEGTRRHVRELDAATYRWAARIARHGKQNVRSVRLGRGVSRERRPRASRRRSPQRASPRKSADAPEPPLGRFARALASLLGGAR